MEVLDQDVSALSINDTASLVQPIMHFVSTALLLGSVAVQAVLGRTGEGRQPTLLKRSVDSFVQTETPIALEQLLCNIGVDGCNAQAAFPGLVIASPSTDNPNCKALRRVYIVSKLTRPRSLQLDSGQCSGVQVPCRQVHQPI